MFVSFYSCHKKTSSSFHLFKNNNLFSKHKKNTVTWHSTWRRLLQFSVSFPLNLCLFHVYNTSFHLCDLNVLLYVVLFLFLIRFPILIIIFESYCRILVLMHVQSSVLISILQMLQLKIIFMCYIYCNHHHYYRIRLVHDKFR